MEDPSGFWPKWMKSVKSYFTKTVTKVYKKVTSYVSNKYNYVSNYIKKRPSVPKANTNYNPKTSATKGAIGGVTDSAGGKVAQNYIKGKVSGFTKTSYTNSKGIPMTGFSKAKYSVSKPQAVSKNVLG